MEKIFTNKKIWKIIVIAFLVVMSIQVMMPLSLATPNTDDTEETESQGDNVQWGGVLLKPILSLAVTLGDGIIYLLHSSIMGTNTSLVPIDLHEGNLLWTITKDVIMGAIIGVTALALLTFVGPGAVIAAAALAVVGTTFGAPVLAPVEEFTLGTMHIVTTLINGEDTPETLYLPMYSYSPEEIFKGKILLFNVDFFSNDAGNTKLKEGKYGKGSTFYYYEDPEGEDLDINGDGTVDTKGYKTSSLDSVVILRKTVSRWYVAIRNICIVAMLSVLIYIGIRMMLTSVANDKAKYKEMLKDWTVGLCLLFIMHYIMAFSVTLTQKFTDMIATSADKNMYTVVLSTTNGSTENGKSLGIKGAKLDALNKQLEEQGLDKVAKDENGNVAWTTNLMGYLRLNLQFGKTGGQYIGELLCFLALVMYTVVFSWTYLKRLLYMVFLTMIAPFVALTYCIDKVNDGQAQGFNTWLKEYIFNLLLQPMHLLLYYILITSAFELAGVNVIYSLVAIGFMLPAEKMLRKLFGFEKAHTPPLLGGPAGTALVMQGMNALKGMAGKNKLGKVAGNAQASAEDDGNIQPIMTSNDLGGELGSGETQSTETAESTPTSTRDGMPSEEQNTDTMDQLDEDEQELYKLRKEVQDDNGGNLSTEDRLAFWQMRQDIIRRKQKLNQGNNTSTEPTEDTQVRTQPTEVPSQDTGTSNNASNTSQTEIHGARGNTRTDDTTRKPQRFRTARKVAKIAGTYARNEGKRMLKKAPGALAGAAAGAFVGASAGALGLAAGIASGDPSKAVGAGAAGLTAGAGVAGAVSSGIQTNGIIWPELQDAINEVNNSPEYQKDRMNSYIKKAKKDENVWKQLEAMNKDVADDLRTNGRFEEYLKLGYGTSKEGLQDMIASEKLIKDDSALTRKITSAQDAAWVRQSANRMGNVNKMSGDKKKKWQDTWAEDYKHYGDSQSKAKQIMDLADMFGKNKPS